MEFNFLIIGETCRDVFIYGCSKRLSPEAPVPVFTPEEEVCTHGMAKNVYYNLLSLVKSYPEKHSVFKHVSSHSATKVRYVDKKTNHYFLRVDTGDDKYERIEFTDELKKLLTNADCVLISDYNKGFLKIDDIIKIRKSVREGCPIILDTKKKVKELLQRQKKMGTALGEAFCSCCLQGRRKTCWVLNIMLSILSSHLQKQLLT